MVAMVVGKGLCLFKLEKKKKLLFLFPNVLG